MAGPPRADPAGVRQPCRRVPDPAELDQAGARHGEAGGLGAGDAAGGGEEGRGGRRRAAQADSPREPRQDRGAARAAVDSRGADGARRPIARGGGVRAGHGMHLPSAQQPRQLLLGRARRDPQGQDPRPSTGAAGGEEHPRLRGRRGGRVPDIAQPAPRLAPPHAQSQCPRGAAADHPAVLAGRQLHRRGPHGGEPLGRASGREVPRGDGRAAGGGQDSVGAPRVCWAGLVRGEVRDSLEGRVHGQESCCTVLLLLAHETSSRSAILADAPEAEAALHQVCQTGMTATARAASEAALWALGHLETPAWGGAHPRPVHNNVMISHHITHLRHAEGLGQAFAGEHRRWAHTGTQGLSNIEAGIRHCTVMIVLLSEEYQASPFCRAEVTAAVALEKPILWIHAAGSTLPPPNDWVRKLADKKQPPIRSRDYGDMKLGRLEFDSMSGTLLPRETFDALFKTVMGKIEVFFPQMDTQAVVQEEEEETVPEDVREVVDWTAKEVGEWVIHSLRLGEYADAFVANSVDGMLLLELDDDDLEHSLRVEDAGHRDKILAAVRFILEHATTAKRT
ncbi:hypothetical protein T484DRAFT_1901837 [Baffinella frigidus]|nr:hypothetical protein T484DRAFT_1901837 [Cryptophyta sp. CCMP2293]